jgi:hypothetical protein
MGPVSLVVSRQQMVGFVPTASMVVLGEKLGTDPRIGQLSYYGLGREPFISGAVACSTLLTTTQKVAIR